MTAQARNANIRNITAEFNKKRSWADRLADSITAFCGTIYFVLLNLLFFGGWIVYHLASETAFDPFPFEMLVTIVSLEAILLAIFILITQNRQGKIFDLRSELDFETNERSEAKIDEMLDLQKKIYNKLSKKKR